MTSGQMTSTALLGAEIAEGVAIGFYLVYATLAVGLVIYLARTLRANGSVWLRDVFDSDELAASVNHLLVIGFYLLNLGYAFLLFQLQPTYASLTEAFNQLTTKVAWLLLSLGVIHLFNMFVFWRIRTHRQRAARPTPPLPRFDTYPPPPLTPNPVPKPS
jgi:nitric oxide reductase large subunit